MPGAAAAASRRRSPWSGPPAQLDPDSKAQRLAAAAELAAGSGQTGWARDLADHALALTLNQRLRSRARYVTGWALAWSGRYGSGATALLSLARETAQGDPATAWNYLSLAAAAAYQSGAPADVAAVAGLLDRLPPDGDGDIAASRLWTLAVTGQAAPARALLAGSQARPTATAPCSTPAPPRGCSTRRPSRPGCWASARDTLADPGARAADGGLLAPLGWAYLDAGRWDDALKLVGAAQGCPVTDVPPAAARLITATVEAARGNTRRARALVAAGLAADPEHGRLLTARAWHALGLCDLADGDYLAALSHLRRLFDDDGNPYHYHASYLAVADLALAAARAGSRPDGQETLKRVTEALAGTGPGPSPRLRQLTARADAILADPATPDAYPDGIPGDPSWDQWPFEHAQLRLELGERLRRRRRINAAKPELEAALEVFRSLRAGPWEQRAESELRACGVAVTGNPRSATGLQELTAQQREIVCLAAQGLSNREIGERMFLSPRTVSSHLYRSYPKLGVATRYQLQGLLAQAAARAADGAPARRGARPRSVPFLRQQMGCSPMSHVNVQPGSCGSPGAEVPRPAYGNRRYGRGWKACGLGGLAGRQARHLAQKVQYFGVELFGNLRRGWVIVNGDLADH